MKKSFPSAAAPRAAALLGLLVAGTLSAQAQIWQWAVKTGQTTVGETSPRRTAVTPAGDVYVAGSFDGTVQFGTTTLTALNDEPDGFLAKYTNTGQVQWAQQFGNPALGQKDEVEALAVDAAGNAYLGLNFESASVTIGGTTYLNSGGSGGSATDALVIKLDPSGQVLWARQIGGLDDEEITGLAAASTGELYVAGTYEDSVQLGGVVLSHHGDSFVAKLDPAGNVIWATGGGSRTHGSSGSGPDLGASGLALSGQQVLITGSFADSARFGSTLLLATTPGQLTPDAFVAALDGTTGQWQWARQSGGTLADWGTAIAADGQGNVLVAGAFASAVVVIGADTLIHAPLTGVAYHNGYVAKLDAAGNWLWATPLTSPSDVWTSALVAEITGDVYLAGAFAGSFQLGATPLTPTVPGEYSGYLTRLDGLSGTPWWATLVDGHGDDPTDVEEILPALARDLGGYLYLAGAFDDQARFGSTTLVTNISHVDDGFLASFSDVLPLPRTLSPAAGPIGSTVTITGQNLGSTTQVMFNGVPATFTVVGPNQITVTVPSGATTGTVSVTTPAGTVSSPIAFRVGPTGLAEPGARAFALWPNPATGVAHLTLAAEAVSPVVEVLDALGRTVRHQRVAAGQTEVLLPLAGLTPGLYAVRIGGATQQLLVQ